MRLVKLALLLFIFLLPMPAQGAVFNAESFTLENGLRVVVIPNHRAPVVTHMIWYQYGAADEAPGKSGIAHFFEHLMFKGTPNVPDGEFSATVRKLGGNDNAFTGQDYTAYYQNIPKIHLARIMEMEADRMNNLTLEEDEVASERQVIVEERHQRVDNQPEALFNEQMSWALYQNHPYAIPIIGWMHEIKNLTREDALKDYKRWYAPNNAIVVLSGDVTAKDVKPLAEKHYGVLETEEIPKRARPKPAPLNANYRLNLKDPRIGIPMFIKKWRVARGSEALDVLAEIAGGTSTARLYKNLVVDQKIAVSAGMQYSPIQMDDTALTVYASPAPGTKMETLEKALNEEIKKLVDKGITKEELDGAKSRKTAKFTLYLDSLQGPAMLFGRALSSGFDIDYLENWTTRINKLSIKDVNDAAKKVFAADNRAVIGTLLPDRGVEE